MTANEVRSRIGELCAHLLFEYKGENCGIDPLAVDTYDMWFGDAVMTARSLDEVMETPFFDGRALKDIVDEIKNVEL